MLRGTDSNAVRTDLATTDARWTPIQARFALCIVTLNGIWRPWLRRHLFLDLGSHSTQSRLRQTRGPAE